MLSVEDKHIECQYFTTQVDRPAEEAGPGLHDRSNAFYSVYFPQSPGL